METVNFIEKNTFLSNFSDQISKIAWNLNFDKNVA